MWNLKLFIVTLLLLWDVGMLSCTNNQGCIPKYFSTDKSFVCVCNETYCDSFESFERTKPMIINKFTTNSKKKRFEKTLHRFDLINFNLNNINDNINGGIDDNFDGQTFIINLNKTYQKLLGFGAAFTDATGINIKKFESVTSSSKSIIENFFGKNGLDLSMGRVPIGGTDFSTKPYTYDDLDHLQPKIFEDFNLKYFNLTEEDFQFKIPLIKKALNLTENQLKLFASPWSPPKWMKTNSRINGEGHIKGEPDGPYYKTWANYLLKFLKEYQKFGIEFWAITIQNEPFDGQISNFSFNCNGMKPETQRDFLFKTLGPLLNESGFGLENLKLMIMDDQRPFIKNWANLILNETDAKNFISGIAFHWYLNKLTTPNVLDEVYEKYPEYFLLSTEACEGSSPFDLEKVSLGNWQRAENYAYDIITDLLHYANGWIDWNMVLDIQGGPNWAKNFVDAPIIINFKEKEYYKQPMYFALAHFTKFLKPESQRIDFLRKPDKNFLEVLLFRNEKENSTIMIVLNRNHDVVPIKILDPKYGQFFDKIDEHSLQTYVWFD